MSWLDGPIAGFDLETTSAEKETCRIVQWSFMLQEEPGAPPKKAGGIVDPGIPIPDEAASIHGITTERAQAEGEPHDQALERIGKALLATVNDHKMPLVIFNAAFDWTVLHNLTLPDKIPTPAWFDVAFFDPLVVSRSFNKYKKGGHKLGTLFAEAGGPSQVLDGAHDAHVDTRMAMWLARQQMQWYASAFEEVELGKLTPTMTTWYRAWAEDFEAYLRKARGDHNIVIHRGWPYCGEEKNVPARA